MNRPAPICPPPIGQPGRRGARGAGWRRLVSPILGLFCLGLLAPAAGAALAATAHDETDTHAEGSPCHDAGPGGHPCSPSCACACCPGHGVAAPLHAGAPRLSAPPARELVTLCPAARLPRGTPQRIFRPPRV